MYFYVQLNTSFIHFILLKYCCGRESKTKKEFFSEKEKDSREKNIKKKSESLKKNKKVILSFCHKPRALLITIDTI